MDLEQHPESNKKALVTLNNVFEALALSAAMTNRLNRASRYLIFNLIHYSSFRELQEIQLKDRYPVEIDLSHTQLRDASKNITVERGDSPDYTFTKLRVKNEIESYIEAL